MKLYHEVIPTITVYCSLVIEKLAFTIAYQLKDSKSKSCSNLTHKLDCIFDSRLDSGHITP